MLSYNFSSSILNEIYFSQGVLIDLLVYFHTFSKHTDNPAEDGGLSISIRLQVIWIIRIYKKIYEFQPET